MADIRGFPTRILFFFLIIFNGFIVLLIIFYKFCRYGRKYFKCEVTEASKNLFDNKLGRHGYCQLKTQGIRIHYVESGDRKNPLVVLLHGFPDFWYSWRHQIPKFSQNYWVVAIDMRGYAGSDCPSNVKSYRMKELVEDVKEVIKTLGKDSSIVIGHDWGGIIAWNLCISYPEIVNKLVILNAPHPAAFRSAILKSWKQFFMSWYILFFQLPYLPELYLRSNNLGFLKRCYQRKDKKGCSDDELKCYKHIFSQPGALTPPLNYYREISNIFNERKSEKVITPTLIIWGDRDLALSTNLVKDSLQYCDNLKIEMVEGVGHWVHQEESTLVNNYIENFLKN